MEIVTNIASTIGGEIANYTLVPLGRHIGYLIFYDGNVNNLTEAVKTLNDKKTAVDLLIDDAESNLRIPAPEMKTWQQNVDSINARAMKFLEEEITRNRKCLSGLCPNPKSRHSSSRKASKMKQEIDRLLTESEKYYQNDLPAPQPALSSMFLSEETDDFESRSLTVEKILEALADDSSSMVSICGQGGVGKTTMVEKLVRLVESRKLFDEVAMAVVSQNPDVKKVLGDIASCLGLKFNEENEQERAKKLHERIIGKFEKRVLLILDDVWTEMDFRSLHVPPAGKRAGYKILLTSRRVDECQRIGCSKNFRVDPLSKEEGWSLFKGIAFAGNTVDERDNLHQLAKEIAGQCDGLPIAIATIAKALKGRGESIWADTLNQLQRSNLKGISGMERVYSRLELSYNLVQLEDAKACFLLCGLFPEDYAIPVEDLVRYMVGLELIHNVDTILQARNRVDVLVGELKESFLLLDGDKEDGGYVKMHDVLRDVAISIAAREKQYLVSCNNAISHWPSTWRSSYSNCAAISLWCKEIKKHPAHLECPKLQLLLLQSRGSLPDNFFDGSNKLKVVDLKGCFPPKSLNELREVRTLHLPQMHTSEVGDLRNIEILKIGVLRELPLGVGSMENLRLLDLKSVYMLKYFPAGILSKLSRLEELYVSLEFVEWELNEDGEKMNASLKELDALPITALEIGISNVSHLPGRSIFEKLKNFKIVHHYEKRYSYEPNYNSSLSRKPGNALSFTGDASELTRRGIGLLLRKTEDLELKKVINLQSDLYELGDDGFPTLKTLQMDDCCEMEHLVDVKNVKEKCFSLLKDIRIESCGTLKFLFPTVVATRLSRSLESIDVDGCILISEIFNGEEEGDDVEFHYLRQINLRHLDNLKALWMHKSNDHQEVKSDGLEHQSCTLFPSSWIVFSSLKVLKLENCPSVKVVFSIAAAEKLLHLQDLTISSCEQVEYVVGGKEENMDKTLIFPKLTKVLFRRLPKLLSFCSHDHVFVDWSSLVDIEIRDCPKIRTIIADNQSLPTPDQQLILFKIPSDFQDLLKLENLETRDCENLRHLFTSRVAKLLVKLKKCMIYGNLNMEQVIAKEEGEEEATKTLEKIAFLQLERVKLLDVPNMSCFSGGIHEMEFPVLKYIEFTHCQSMKTFCYGSLLRTPTLHTIIINDRNINPTMGDLNTVVRQEMLTTLHFYDEQGLERISLHHLSNEEMSKVRKIKINNCHDLLNVVPCNLIAELQKVEIIEVDNCSSVEEIFEYNGVNDAKENVVVSSHLQQLILSNLLDLKHVLNKIPASVIVFGKLKLLSLDTCEIQNNIFSVSAVHGLIQLEQLKISSCYNLEEIIAEENNEEKAVSNKIVLPQLLSVEISEVPGLKYFYRGNCTLELPSLRSIKLNCQRLESFSNGTVNTPQLMQVQINEDCPYIEDLNEYFKIQNFETVDIEDSEDVTKILASGYSCRIKHLNISKCHTLLNAIPYNLIRNIEKLEKLTVESSSVEEIFECGANTEETSVSVILNLEEISLRYLHELKHIFNKIPTSVVSFQKLRKLEICLCGNLESIFSISSIKDLIQLEELNISDCDGLEQILVQEEEEDDDGDDNEEETEEDEEIEEEVISNKVEFQQLRRVNISCGGEGLFRLKCFYNGRYALKFPLLESLSLNRCYGMTSFSNGSLSTPMLQQVRINEKQYPCADDLNQVLKNRMLEIVVVGNDEHFSRILHTAREASSQIHSLTYRNEDCDQSLRSEHEAKKKGPRANRPGPVVEIQEAIPCSAIQNVEQIHLRHCDSLEVIFECDKETAFSTLEEISLVAMGNLKYIFNKIPQGFIGFQQLKSLKINSCEKLEYVFPVSMVRGLLQLQEITISYCSNIKQIIAEEEANPFTDKIILPRLNSIYVYCLGNLKCFYNGFCHIELPQLQSLFIEMSDGIKCFSNGSVSTPLLQDLDTGSNVIPCSGNLNADIMEMWQSRWAD